MKNNDKIQWQSCNNRHTNKEEEEQRGGLRTSADDDGDDDDGDDDVSDGDSCSEQLEDLIQNKHQ